MSKRQADRSVVIGAIGADAHMIGGWVLEKAFRATVLTVAFLGAVVPRQEFVNAAIEIDAGLDDVMLHGGGMVVAPTEIKKNRPEVELCFKGPGFDRVFPDTCTLEEAVAALKADLGIVD